MKGLTEEIARKFLKEKGYLTDILWSIDDIKHMSEKNKFDLSNQQLIEISESIQKYHDAEYGINWFSIESAIEYYCEEKGIKKNK
jgi:uncharacterized protein YjfI (DUF2170 family)